LKPPPLLLGATLLFWGWQTGLLWLGAVAAALLEGSRWMRARWDFSQGDLDRIWNFCVVLFFGAAMFAFASNDGLNTVGTLIGDNSLAERSEALNKGARSVLLFFQWMPLTFLPIALAQAFGQRERLDWSTFSWWLRRQRRSADSQSASEKPFFTNFSGRAGEHKHRVPPHPGPLPQGEGAERPALGEIWRTRPVDKRQSILPLPEGEARGEGERGFQTSRIPADEIHEKLAKSDPGLNVLWPFFAVCMLAASAANDRSSHFPIGLALLTGWALWATRPRRVPTLRWSACALAAILLGLGSLEGLLLARSAVQRFENTLVARFASGRNFDPRESRTMLGEIGRLKLSGRIVLRVETDGQPPPELLREVSYTQFKSPHWTATRQEFANFLPDSDETTWRLLHGKLGKRKVAIASLFSGGAGLLALPQGAGQLDDLPAFVMETNRLGEVRMSSGPGFARYHATHGEGASIDSAPDAEDLEVPPAERGAISQVAEELKLNGQRPEEALQTVANFFTQQFR
jgi:hypothetical protein